MCSVSFYLLLILFCTSLFNCFLRESHLFSSHLFFCHLHYFLFSALISMFLSLLVQSSRSISRDGRFLDSFVGDNNQVSETSHMFLKCWLLRLLETRHSCYYFHGGCDLLPEVSHVRVLRMCADLSGTGDSQVNILLK
jgi:hypothetical protein